MGWIEEEEQRAEAANGFANEQAANKHARDAVKRILKGVYPTEERLIAFEQLAALQKRKGKSGPELADEMFDLILAKYGEL